MGRTWRMTKGGDRILEKQLKSAKRLEMAKLSRTDFRCTHCKAMVSGIAPGTAHRNHCPACLWSKHVDAGVGDRLGIACGGGMRPLKVRLPTGDIQLLHVCQNCGKEKWNRIAADDDIGVLLSLKAECNEEERRAALFGNTPARGGA